VTAEANPNGSARNIAGIVNAAGNVLGMMPHPERAVDPLLGGEDGVGSPVARAGTWREGEGAIGVRGSVAESFFARLACATPELEAKISQLISYELKATS
jgi:hypothetical protein